MELERPLTTFKEGLLGPEFGTVTTHLIQTMVGLSWTPEPEWMPPDGPGEYRAGTDKYSLEGSTGYTLPVQVWYPTNQDLSATYSYDELYPGEAEGMALPKCDTPRPVVLFSHGNTGIRWQSAFLMERLATHGFVVVAPDHVTNTFLDNQPELFSEHVLRRPQDIRDTYEWLIDEVQQTDSALVGCVDPEGGYAVAGHSFGGYTAAMVAGAQIPIAELDAMCASYSTACVVRDAWLADHPGTEAVDLGDDRVWASVGLAPWDAAVLGMGMAAIESPAMVLTGEDDVTTPLAMTQGLYDALETQPRHMVIMKKAGHFSFSPIACSLFSGDGCGEDSLPLADVERLTNHVVTGFFQVSLGWEGARDSWPVDSEWLEWESVE